MRELFSEPASSDDRDGELVALAHEGSRDALEELVRRHQAWIYNVARRMVGDPDDAADVTQEVLIKMIAQLSTFRAESSFRTWLYRIAANHIMNMARRPREYPLSSFESHGRLIDTAPEGDLRELEICSAEAALLVEETKVGCMMGMLLCLDRSQRLAFTLGAIFGASAATGAEILSITPQNYRQILSRARRQMANFMNEKCGLMQPGNPCRCAKKTRAAIEAGYIDPEHLQFAEGHVTKVRQVATRCVESVNDLLEERAVDLFREHPFLRTPDFASAMMALFGCLQMASPPS